jgi:hypothetical protein
MEAVQSQAELFEVVGTAGAVGRFAHLLHRWHQQPDQHRDDGDHHQQLDQREATSREQTLAAKHAKSSTFDGTVARVDHRGQHLQRGEWIRVLAALDPRARPGRVQ